MQESVTSENYLLCLGDTQDFGQPARVSRSEDHFPSKLALRRTMTVKGVIATKPIIKKYKTTFTATASEAPPQNCTLIEPPSMTTLRVSGEEAISRILESQDGHRCRASTSPQNFCSTTSTFRIMASPPRLLQFGLVLLIFLSTLVSGAPLEEKVSYSIHPKGRVYLPTFQLNGAASSSSPVRDGEVAGGEGGSPNNFRFHLEQTTEEEHPFLRRQQAIQKQKDFGDNVLRDSDENEDGLSGRNQEDLGQSEWETVIDPQLYVLTEYAQPFQEQFPLMQQRKRRNSGTGPSLSIVNPLDVLRQRLLLEIARRRMRQSHNQIIANEEILRKIGRRRR